MMKQLVLALGLIVLFAAPCLAQSTGPSLTQGLGSQLGNQLTARKGYRVEISGNYVRLIDAGTGAEVLSMNVVSPQRVTISGVVGSMKGLSPEMRKHLLERIAFFNFSSAVGTLSIDDMTGQVTMKHELNPRLVSIPAMANVAAQFSDVARAQTVALKQ